MCMTIQKSSSIRLNKHKRRLITKSFVLVLLSHLQSLLFQESAKVNILVKNNEMMTTYDIQEFIENYSNSSGFEELIVNIYDKHDNSLRMIITSSQILMNLTAFSGYTLAQAEDFIDKIQKYISDSFHECHNSHTDSNGAAGGVNNTGYNPWYKEAWVWEFIGIIVALAGIVIPLLATYCFA